MDLIECIPNISEGQNLTFLDRLSTIISNSEGVELKNRDIGKSVHRTVFTFIGKEDDIIETVYKLYEACFNLIDMSKHKGTHPRMGAIDVCPFVILGDNHPIQLQNKIQILAKKIADHFQIPIFLYEKSALFSNRKYLASIRKGEYEGWFEKINHPEWTPDFGPKQFHKTFGGSVMGHRDLLIAINININGGSLEIANQIAKEIRETGYWTQINGEKVHFKGLHRGVRAIGWYIPEFKKMQVSINITDIKSSPLHMVFRSCIERAIKYDTYVEGCELIGLIPESSLIETGIFINSNNVKPTDQLIDLAIKWLALSNVKPFNPNEHILRGV